MRENEEEEVMKNRRGTGWGMILGTVIGAGICYGAMKLKDRLSNEEDEEDFLVDDLEDDED